MDDALDPPTPEARRLRRCLSDLVSIMALPALWADGEPRHIGTTLLDALAAMLRPAFVHVRLNDPEGGPPIEMTRVDETLVDAGEARDIGTAIALARTAPAPDGPTRTRMSAGGVDLSVASAHLGLQGELGTVTVASPDPDFPAQTERLLLDVAANQAAIGLQQARLLRHEKGVARELDERVARRTRELERASEALRELQTATVARRARRDNGRAGGVDCPRGEPAALRHHHQRRHVPSDAGCGAAERRRRPRNRETNHS